MDADFFSVKGGLIRRDGQLWFVEKLDEHRGHIFSVRDVVYSAHSPYQKIDIIDTHAYGRMLVLDDDPQSAEADEFIYHESLVHPALLGLRRREAVSVLILGVGEGAAIRECLCHPNVERVVGVEIDEMMLAAARQHLLAWHGGALDDPRVEIVIADAADWIRSTEEVFEAAIFDLTCPHQESPSRDLFDFEFFTQLKMRLKPDGVLAAQADYQDVGRGVTAELLETFKRIFGQAESYGAFIPSFYCVWNFIICSDVPELIHSSRDQAEPYFKKHLGSLRYLTPELLGGLCSRAGMAT